MGLQVQSYGNVSMIFSFYCLNFQKELTQQTSRFEGVSARSRGKSCHICCFLTCFLVVVTVLRIHIFINGDALFLRSILMQPYFFQLRLSRKIVAAFLEFVCEPKHSNSSIVLVLVVLIIWLLCPMESQCVCVTHSTSSHYLNTLIPTFTTNYMVYIRGEDEPFLRQIDRYSCLKYFSVCLSKHRGLSYLFIK